MAYEVFISYTSRDRRAAREICEVIESTGLASWMAPRDVPPGSDYAATLYNALERASALVLVFSRRTSTSPHVLREVKHARDRHIPVFLIRIDSSAPKGPLALLVNTLQWIDHSTFVPDRLPDELALAPKRATPTTVPIPSRISFLPTPSHRYRWVRLALIIGFVVSVGGLSSVVWLHRHMSPRPSVLPNPPKAAYNNEAMARAVLLVTVGYDAEEYTFSIVISDAARAGVLRQRMANILKDIGIDPAILDNGDVKDKIAAILSDPFDVAGFWLGSHIGRVHFLAAVVLSHSSSGLRDLSIKELHRELELIEGRARELELIAGWGLNAVDFENLQLRPGMTLAEYSRRLELFKERVQAALYARMSIP